VVLRESKNLDDAGPKGIELINFTDRNTLALLNERDGCGMGAILQRAKVKPLIIFEVGDAKGKVRRRVK
jgi:hypothetical protein